MLKKLALICLSATIAVSAKNANSCPKRSYAPSVSYYSPCNGGVYKLYCGSGAVKCTIDRYQSNDGDSYYIDSYAQNHEEVKHKKLLTKARFARFCRIHFADKVKVNACDTSAALISLKQNATKSNVFYTFGVYTETVVGDHVHSCFLINGKDDCFWGDVGLGEEQKPQKI